MIVTLIAGVITGFIISVPPMGPVAFALISKGFKNEFKEGMSIAAGSAFMDFVYALIAFGGVSLFISILPQTLEDFYRHNFELIRIIMIYTGCFIVIYYGYKIKKNKMSYEIIQSKEEELLQTQLKAEEVQKVAKGITRRKRDKNGNDLTDYFGLFFMGIMLCISSITLPASWIALVGYIKGLGVIQSSFWGGLIFSGGAFLGTVLWFYLLLKLITGNSHRINPLTMDKLNKWAGIVLIVLGIILFVRATVDIFHLTIL